MSDAGVVILGAGLVCAVTERDHRVGSINGAMASGRDAAAAVIADQRESAP